MKNLAGLGAAFLLAIVASAADAQAAGCGTAEVVKGKVEIKRSGGAAEALAQGGKICAGDVVKTADEARVKIVMEDSNVLNINPGSEIKIENYENDPASKKKKVLLNVMYGKMRATVNQKYDGKSSSGEPQLFQVKTKSAVAGVRGTDFLTSFDRKTSQMKVTTFEGRVEVGQPGPGGSITNSVKVSAGQETAASPGQAPAPPKPVPASELKSLDQESQAPAQTGGGSSGSSAGDSGGKDDGKGKESKDDKQANGDKKGEGGDKKEGDKQAGDKKGGEGDKKNADGDKKQANNDGKGGDKKGEGGDKRGPASEGGSKPAAPKTGMQVEGDLNNTGPAMGPVSGPSAPVAPPLVFQPPITQPIVEPPKIDFVNNVIQNGPAKVNVKICIPNGSGGCQ